MKNLFLLLAFSFFGCNLPRVPTPQEVEGIYFFQFTYYKEYIEIRNDFSYFHFVIGEKKDTLASYSGKWIIYPDEPSIYLCGFRLFNLWTYKISVNSKSKWGVRFEDTIWSPPILLVESDLPFEKIL